MTADIEVYTFEDADGTEHTFHTQNADEARAYASKHRLRWMAQIYTWEDSDLVEDYTDSSEGEDERQ